mmetsp:Transcript_21331/g.20494  ORF Transcript_21331/g.20494 Transcript_21331/m.20494 type:complete len:155 (-) Transcript_21331:3-467(-)
MAWAHLIMIFFPIPLFCLFILAFPLPKKLERMGTAAVSKIFFTKIHLGFFRIQLLWLFFGMSCFIFANSVFVVVQKQEVTATGDNLWYRKAQRFRAERNFWLSLFNVFLWLIVFEIHCLKKLVVQLKSQAGEMKKVIESVATEKLKDEGAKKKN